jgi:hypothetical protein
MTYRQWLILQCALADYKQLLVTDRGQWDERDGPYPGFGEVDEVLEELSEIVTVLTPKE